ncbi:MAG: hypothetical protein Q6K08_06020 [Thermostichales cyanobacterium GMQP_bins_62]
MASAPLWLAGLLLPLLVSCGRSPLTQNPIDTAVSSRRPWTPSTPPPPPARAPPPPPPPAPPAGGAPPRPGSC